MDDLEKECRLGIGARRSEVHETFRRRGIDLNSPEGRRGKEGEISTTRVRRYIREEKHAQEAKALARIAESCCIRAGDHPTFQPIIIQSADAH